MSFMFVGTGEGWLIILVVVDCRCRLCPSGQFAEGTGNSGYVVLLYLFSVFSVVKKRCVHSL